VRPVRPNFFKPRGSCLLFARAASADAAHFQSLFTPQGQAERAHRQRQRGGPTVARPGTAQSMSSSGALAVLRLIATV
jgi:hypothetical protein